MPVTLQGRRFCSARIGTAVLAGKRLSEQQVRELPIQMTMLLLDQGQRELLADKLPDAANLAVGALFFGQFLSDRPFSIGLAFAGIGAWAALVVWGLVLARRRNR